MKKLRLAVARDSGITFISILVLTCILNVYHLTNYEISIDDESQYLGGSNVANWWYSIGRWGAGILSSVSPHSFVVPFATSFIFCLSLSISYFLLCEIHCIRERWKILSALPLFILFPTWAFYPIILLCPPCCLARALIDGFRCISHARTEYRWSPYA